MEKYYIENYRDFRKLELNISENITIFCGPNGIGKTSVIELIEFTKKFNSFNISGIKSVENTDDFFVTHVWQEKNHLSMLNIHLNSWKFLQEKIINV